MSRSHVLKESLFESRLFLNRSVAALATVVLLCTGLVGRLIYLQIIGHEHYATLSHSNRIKIEPLPPTRGLILDRNGEVLAENIPTYSLELVPELVSDLEATLYGLQRLLHLSAEEIHRFLRQKDRSRPFEGIPLRLRLSEEEVARFAVNRLKFPGVDIRARLLRYYPYGVLTSHVVGYVGRISETDLQEIDPAAYSGTYHVGKTGVERFYETMLHGQTGYAEVETNAQGRPVHQIGSVPSSPGADLHLSLDIKLQKAAYDALGEENGAVVALETRTGRILVLASKPGFDPNPFVFGMDSETYNALQTSISQPLHNRALRGQYPPGSTIKPFVALAGLETGVTGSHRRVACRGFYQLPNVAHKYRDWKKRGHGWVDLKAAVVQSCDVYFYDLAHYLGIDRMDKFLQQFGFGQKTNVDLVGEKPGLLPSRAWKRRTRNQSWYPGETLITGIGQGFWQVTPMQLAYATAILANGGAVMKPHVVESMVFSDKTVVPQWKGDNVVPVDERNWKEIVDAMIDVVHGARGTARRLGANIDYQIAGKTGTAQVFTVKQEEKYEEHKIPKALRDHALFIAFAPARDPQIAVSVVVENGGHGSSVAAPIAGLIIDRYLRDGG